MDTSPPLSSLLRRQRNGEGHRGLPSGTNGSVTSYEEIPGGVSVNGDLSADAMSESNRGLVMQALRNLQEKIQRLELERSDAETDMRHLASETARFRQLLNKPKDKQPSPEVSTEALQIDVDNRRKAEGIGSASERQQPTHEGPAVPPAIPPAERAPKVGSGHVGPNSSSMEMALNSAETRCTILEKQLAYMRTLLETAEQDRNEAQRRSRTRGEQLMVWRREAEAQLCRLEEELKAERHRNLLLCENAKSVHVQLGRDLSPVRLHDQLPGPDRDAGLLSASTPISKVAETARHRRAPDQAKSGRTGRRDQSAASAAAAAPVPFVVGRSVGPSHNVNVNLQKVLGMLTKGGPGPGPIGRRSRQLRDEQVDRQLTRDVGVVLEELVDEFDLLCREHQALVRRLADASEAREKTQLEHRLADLVNRMEVKGQQIGRLRSYLATVEAEPGGDGRSRSAKAEARTATEAHPPTAGLETAAAVVEGETRRERSLRLLKTAKRWQACSLDASDVSWH